VQTTAGIHLQSFRLAEFCLLRGSNFLWFFLMNFYNCSTSAEYALSYTSQELAVDSAHRVTDAGSPGSLTVTPVMTMGTGPEISECGRLTEGPQQFDEKDWTDTEIFLPLGRASCLVATQFTAEGFLH
jgi:hypothetical protein